MISMNQQDQRNESAKDREVDYDVPIDRKPFVIQRERIEELFPSARDCEEVHHSQTRVAEVSEYPHCNTKAERNLQSAHGIDLKQAEIDLVKVAREPLILTGRNQLMRSPQEDEIRQPNAQDQQRNAFAAAAYFNVHGSSLVSCV